MLLSELQEHMTLQQIFCFVSKHEEKEASLLHTPILCIFQMFKVILLMDITDKTDSSYYLFAMKRVDTDLCKEK